LNAAFLDGDRTRQGSAADPAAVCGTLTPA